MDELSNDNYQMNNAWSSAAEQAIPADASQRMLLVAHMLEAADPRIRRRVPEILRTLWDEDAEFVEQTLCELIERLTRDEGEEPYLRFSALLELALSRRGREDPALQRFLLERAAHELSPVVSRVIPWLLADGRHASAVPEIAALVGQHRAVGGEAAQALVHAYWDQPVWIGELLLEILPKADPSNQPAILQAIGALLTIHPQRESMLSTIDSILDGAPFLMNVWTHQRTLLAAREGTVEPPMEWSFETFHPSRYVISTQSGNEYRLSLAAGPVGFAISAPIADPLARLADAMAGFACLAVPSTVRALTEVKLEFGHPEIPASWQCLEGRRFGQNGKLFQPKHGPGEVFQPHDGDATYVIDAIAKRFSVYATSFTPRTCKVVVGYLIAILGQELRSRGWLAIHAAAAAAGSDVYLIAGAKGTGKTSLLMKLLLSGSFGLVSGDKVFAKDLDQVLSFPGMVNIAMPTALQEPMRSFLKFSDEDAVIEPKIWDLSPTVLQAFPPEYKVRLEWGRVARSLSVRSQPGGRLRGIIFPQFASWRFIPEIRVLGREEIASRIRENLLVGRPRHVNWQSTERDPASDEVISQPSEHVIGVELGFGPHTPVGALVRSVLANDES